MRKQNFLKPVLAPCFLAAFIVPFLFIQNIAKAGSYPLTPPVTPPVTPPIINHAPVIVTETLPFGTVRKSYNGMIWATDGDNDYLYLTVSGLPREFTANCYSYYGSASCLLSGKPKKAGSYTLTATVYDFHGGQTSKVFKLEILK